jgi:DNA repair photolyase
LTSGCAHECIYCYARGYSVFPGENKVVIYKNILDKLKSELLRRRNKPQVVYFSPSSDIFQPIPEVLELCHSVLELLLSRGIGIALLTKGQIPKKTLALLLAHADKVRVQIGLITCDENVRGLFEPHAANIEVRLRQIAKMIGGGIATEARIIPIIPGVTDTSDSIDRLFNLIAAAGVKQAAISTLFVRPAIIVSLKRHVSDKLVLQNLLNFYQDGRRLPVHAEHSSVIPLPLSKRKEIYARFRQQAKNYAINLSVCGCMNPDIGGTCNITGNWQSNDTQQQLLGWRE